MCCAPPPPGGVFLFMFFVAAVFSLCLGFVAFYRQFCLFVVSMLGCLSVVCQLCCSLCVNVFVAFFMSKAGALHT